MLKHTTTGIKGEMIQEVSGKVASLAKKGIITIMTSNGIKFSAPIDQFKQETR